MTDARATTGRQPNYRAVLLGFVVGAVAPGAGAAAAPRTADRVAAVVNEEVVLLSEVEERLGQDLQRSGQSLAELRGAERNKALKRTLDDLIADKLLDSEMRSLSIEVADHEVDYALEDVLKQNKMEKEQFEKALGREGFTVASYREFLQKQLARMKLLQLKVRSKVRVSDVKAEHARRAQMEGQDDEIHARHLILKLPKGASPKDEEAVVARAQDLARRARAGEDFVALIKKHSEGPSRDDGGDLGWFRRGVMVGEFEKVAFALKAGEISVPVKTNFGFHVVKVEERRKLAPKPFDEVREELRERLLRDQMAQYTQSYVDELRRASVVEVKIPELRDGSE